MDEARMRYLEMIQEPICRMSTVSSVLKGFVATIVAGISTISYSSTSIWVLLLSFLPILAFLSMDIYYLSLERRFRYLYEQVRLKKHKVDFSMALKKDKTEMIQAKARVIDCITSPCIYLFYPIIIGVAIAVVVLKWFSII